MFCPEVNQCSVASPHEGGGACQLIVLNLTKMCLTGSSGPRALVGYKPGRLCFFRKQQSAVLLKNDPVASTLDIVLRYILLVLMTTV